MTQDAQEIMDDNLGFPDVCLKKYRELMAEENWKAALQLLFIMSSVSIIQI